MDQEPRGRRITVLSSFGYGDNIKDYSGQVFYTQEIIICDWHDPDFNYQEKLKIRRSSYASKAGVH